MQNTPQPPTNDAIRAHAAELVRKHGPNRAAKLLGIGRSATLSLASGAPADPGTFARVAMHLQQAPMAISHLGMPEARRG